MQPYLIIILFNLVLFYPALKCLIIVDDVRWYGRIKAKEWPFNEGPKWNNFIQWIAVRLYSGGTFGVNFEQKPKVMRVGNIGFGEFTSIQIDHAFSILLQAVICCLAYADFHSLIGNNQAIWAVLLFASSSITTHIAVWLNGRRYAVNIILVLLMVCCFNAGGWYRLLALPLYAITPLFHMTAFFAPVLWLPSIPIMVLLLVFFWKPLYAKVMVRLDSIFDCDRKYLKPRRIIVIIKTYGFYFWKMILPLQTRTCYGFLYMWGETPEGDKDAYSINLSFWKGASALAITSIAFCILPSNLRGYLLFASLSTLQWCNIINATQVVADRYACMPLVFMSVILSHFLPWQICLAMVVLNTAMTSQCYRMYENIQGMFDYHFFHWPNVTLVNKEYIAFCIKQGDYIKAYTLTRECLRHNPTDFALLHAGAVCARVANDRVTARRYCDIAEKHLYYGQEDTQRRWLANFRASL